MENIVLCGSNAYNKKYYLNPEFNKLPTSIKEELQIMCVLFTEEIGGVLTLSFEPDGNLLIETDAKDADYFYDDIGAGLKISKMRREKEELFESLELYFKVIYLGMDAASLLIGEES